MIAFNKAYLFTLLLLIGACTPSLYQVVNDHSYETVAQQAQKKKMVLINEGLLGTDYSDSILYLLNKKQWKQLDSKLGTLTDPYVKDFLQSIVWMIEGKYELAFHLLNELPDEGFGCQVNILKTDCLYEFNVEQVSFLNRYQQALDCATNPQIKSIAKTRYRFVKYGY